MHSFLTAVNYQEIALSMTLLHLRHQSLDHRMSIANMANSVFLRLDEDEHCKAATVVTSVLNKSSFKGLYVMNSECSWREGSRAAGVSWSLQDDSSVI